MDSEGNFRILAGYAATPSRSAERGAFLRKKQNAMIPRESEVTAQEIG